MTRLAQSATRSVTSRQRQVVALVARGLTTKEIAHELHISERGVSAHISRLLAKFDVSNRAGLVARTFSEVVRGTVTVASPAADLRVLPAEVAGELEGFKTSKFLVTMTLGRDPIFSFMNDAAAAVMGVDATAIIGVRVRDRLRDPSIRPWLEMREKSFQSGVPVSLENFPSRWLSDDGTSKTAVFDCVLQPVRDVTGEVIGMLAICALSSVPASSVHPAS